MSLSKKQQFVLRAYQCLLLGCLCFIAVASFYLSSRGAPSAEAAWQLILKKGSAFEFSFHNLRDVSTNILLYMPLGFLLAFLLACKKTPHFYSPHLLWGFVISIAVEITQAFIGRYSDVSDVISNGMGYIIGFVVAVGAMRFFALRPEHLLGFSIDSQGLEQEHGDQARLASIQGIRFIYIAIVVVACLLPFNVTVSLSEIVSKLTSVDGAMPRLILDPFHHFKVAGQLRYISLNIILFIPLAFLSAFIARQNGSARSLSPALQCLLLAAAIEGANVFIRSGRSDILVLILAFSVGLIVEMLFVRYWPGSAGPSTKINGKYIKKSKINGSGYNGQIIMTATLCYALFLLIVALTPFEFEVSLHALKAKILSDSNLIPFKAHFSARSIPVAIDIVRELILFVPLGMLISAYLKQTNLLTGLNALIVSSVLCASYALALELGQLLVVSRYVDITDPILASAGGVLGCWILPLFSQHAVSAKSAS